MKDWHQYQMQQASTEMGANANLPLVGQVKLIMLMVSILMQSNRSQIGLFGM